MLLVYAYSVTFRRTPPPPPRPPTTRSSMCDNVSLIGAGAAGAAGAAFSNTLTLEISGVVTPFSNFGLGLGSELF